MNEDSSHLARLAESVSRSHSQELLDSSSASSISVFIDHSDAHNNSQSNEDNQKSEGNSKRASMDEALKSEAAFIQYVMSIPPKETSEHYRSVDTVSTKSKTSTAAPTVSKVGLDHLDNLCKLMEQLGELRDTNGKLQKRVQYLEDLKTLHDMHKEICEGREYSSEDALASKPGPYPLTKSATESHCPKVAETQALGSSRSPSRYLNRRSRNQQTGGPRRGRSKSVGHEDLVEDPKSRRLFPKWSKVKEAFGWESDRKESVKMKVECDNLLSSRRRSDDSRQTYRHPGSPTWYQDCPSIHSSVGDINADYEEDRWKKTSVVSDKFMAHLETHHEVTGRQESTPSPGSDKVACYRYATDLKPKSSTIERDSYRNQDFLKFDKDDGKRGKSPWGRVKTIIERHRDSLKRRSIRRDHSTMDFDPTISKNETGSLDFKTYAEYLEPPPNKSSGILKQKSTRPGSIVLDQPEECCGPRTPSSSPTFQRKSRWNWGTKAWKGKKEGEKDPMSLSTPTSPNSGEDGNFTFDVIEEISPDAYGERRELSRVGSDSHVHNLALAVPSSDLMLQLQRNLSEDFHRKILEWERIRASGNASSSPQWDRKPSDASRSRKKSERDDKTIKPKIKDLTWLEKELQKIEKEKERLSKERQKYEERALRLEKLKETVLSANNSNKREVLVRTSAGEFRFEGISDAFTKKLYEWETKRGLGPELSTIALLDSSLPIVQPVLGSKIGPMQRVLSRSESSIADIGQPSHNSSNSLPSVKLPDSMEADRPNHSSRANSEPDLNVLVAFSTGTNLSASNLTRQAADGSECDVATIGAGKGSDEEECDKRKGSETYYGILEENVILLEQLKEKEEICRRLEKDLEMLDEKMDEMNAHHVQETHRYREKLWEMHKLGATPRDVQCCRYTMVQLRKRIEALERWTEKLRSDRETVEVNFRHHSKEQESMTLDFLEKMRELQAVRSSSAGNEARQSPHLDATTIERLQDLSALLTKQTRELEETLSEKTRQICQLKWELLHRDLSNIKRETELHNHTALKKRSKYAHWRSRSSEEAPASTCPQKSDLENFEVVSADMYGSTLPIDEFKATHLANTVQQLNKEVLKLTSATSNSSLTKQLQDENLHSIPMTMPKNVEGSKHYKRIQSPSKDHSRKITVRRSSADNLSLVSIRDNKLKDEHSPSTHSDDSSDEYYSRICCNSGIKNNQGNNSDTERLLMSYGEHPPRTGTQRRKKLQRSSKLQQSSLSRKRSNTFHTNRDLQKPNIGENTPQKCQSFREAREKKQFEYSTIEKPTAIKLKFQKLPYYSKPQERMNYKINNDHDFPSAVLHENNVEKSEILNCYDTIWLREVASDSKIPFLMQAQNYAKDGLCEGKIVGKSPSRSMSDKTKKETAIERREYIQKKRIKKRLKSPDSSCIINMTEANQNASESIPQYDSSKLGGHGRVNSTSSTAVPCCQRDNGKSRNEVNGDSEFNILSSHTEIPTITLQLPKRKQSRTSCNSSDDIQALEEESFTIAIPKKRSLSTEHESSVSESSSRDISKSPHSDGIYPFPDTCNAKDSLTDCHSNSTATSKTEIRTEANGKIRLMRLVSLNNFESPFEHKGDCVTNVGQDSELQPRKRKAEDTDCSGKHSPTEEMIDMISSRSNSHNLNKSSTAYIERDVANNTSSPSYMKSPSAPQLDWRKVCAKKVSKEGAPNVRTLIEKYNKKVMESQICTSPESSNFSSPITPRKISVPSYSSVQSDFVPHFFSTPNTPSIAPPFCNSPLSFANMDFSKSPPPSPSSAARSDALRRAKENFITSKNSAPSTPASFRSVDSFRKTTHICDGSRNLVGKQKDDWSSGVRNTAANLERSISEDDRMSYSSMDSMNIVMMRAGENCRESRLPKRTADYQRSEAPSADGNKLKTSKSLSSSSLFKTVLNSDFKLPTNFLKLKRSKRKKDMSTVTELCRQSLLLTTDDVANIPSAATHKSCPNSPELKTKDAAKPNWLHRNIFRQK